MCAEPELTGDRGDTVDHFSRAVRRRSCTDERHVWWASPVIELVSYASSVARKQGNSRGRWVCWETTFVTLTVGEMKCLLIDNPRGNRATGLVDQS